MTHFWTRILRNIVGWSWLDCRVWIWLQCKIGNVVGGWTCLDQIVMLGCHRVLNGRITIRNWTQERQNSYRMSGILFGSLLVCGLMYNVLVRIFFLLEVGVMELDAFIRVGLYYFIFNSYVIYGDIRKVIRVMVMNRWNILPAEEQRKIPYYFA
jgi:hypothetical protein